MVKTSFGTDSIAGTGKRRGLSEDFRPGPSLGRGMTSGLMAGVIGGIAFGAAMIELGLLESIALLVRAESATVGFAVQLVVAAVIGAGFGALAAYNRPDPGETVIWGLTYGAVWWFIGPLTLLPIFLGEGPT